MRKILTAALGILCGIAIIVMAFQFNGATYDANSIKMDTLNARGTDPVLVEDNWSPAYERDYYYGGDAYTGMQQAAAQAANNVLAMEETLRQTNNDLVAINDNIKATNANIAALNNNIAKVLQALANEQGNATTASVRTISQLGFFLLLAIGALTEVKYIGLLLDGIAESRKSKVPEVQEAPVAEEA